MRAEDLAVRLQDRYVVYKTFFIASEAVIVNSDGFAATLVYIQLAH